MSLGMSRHIAQAESDAAVSDDGSSASPVVVTATPVQVPRPSNAAFVQAAKSSMLKDDTLPALAEPLTEQPASALSANLSVAASTVTDPAIQSLADSDGYLICTRCKLPKPIRSFLKPSRPDGPYKFCETCREQSRQHTSDTRKRKRESERMNGDDSVDMSDAGMHGMGSGDMIEITDFAQFEANFPVAPANVDPELTAASESGALPVPDDQVQLHQRAFILRGSVSLDGGLTTIAESLQGIDSEPVELFKKIVQTIYDITGFYFARRAKSKSGKSFRTQYVCSQVADTSNKRDTNAQKRARARRPLYNCHGRLILAASLSDHSVVVKYTHRIVHGPATRRRYLPEIVKEYISDHRGSPLSEIYAGIKELSTLAPESQAFDINKISRKQVYIYLKRLEENLNAAAAVRVLIEESDVYTGPDLHESNASELPVKGGAVA